MIERGLYYATPDFQQLVQSVGGVWNDTKHRPIVCLIKSSENDNLYWAIPMGKLNHRDSKQQERLNSFLNRPERDIRSCFYHTGRTTTKSIFFISDAIPITDKYIDGIHVGADKQHFIIKNPNLIAELERKLLRILSVENSDKNHFRQHITDVKNQLLTELAEIEEESKTPRNSDNEIQNKAETESDDNAKTENTNEKDTSALETALPESESVSEDSDSVSEVIIAAPNVSEDTQIKPQVSSANASE